MRAIESRVLIIGIFALVGMLWIAGSAFGQVLPTLTVSSSSLTFPAQMIGTGASPQRITVTNIDSVVHNVYVRLNGTGCEGGSPGCDNPPGFDDFPFTTSCEQSTVLPGGSCSVSIGFIPTSAGPRTSNIAIGTGPGQNLTVALIGTGVGSASVPGLTLPMVLVLIALVAAITPLSRLRED